MSTAKYLKPKKALIKTPIQKVGGFTLWATTVSVGGVYHHQTASLQRPFIQD